MCLFDFIEFLFFCNHKLKVGQYLVTNYLQHLRKSFAAHSIENFSPFLSVNYTLQHPPLKFIKSINSLYEIKINKILLI